MPRHFRKAVVATALAGVLAAGAATPASAGGWGYRHGWGHRHWGGGGAVAAGVLGGLALGAIAGAAAQQPYYGPGYAGAGYGYPAYGGCYLVDQPVTDGWGNFVGYQQTQVCE